MVSKSWHALTFSRHGCIQEKDMARGSLLILLIPQKKILKLHGERMSWKIKQIITKRAYHEPELKLKLELELFLELDFIFLIKQITINFTLYLYFHH